MSFKRNQSISKALDIGITNSIRTAFEDAWSHNNFNMTYIRAFQDTSCVRIKGMRHSRACNIKIILENAGCFEYVKNNFCSKWVQSDNNYIYYLTIKEQYLEHFPILDL